MPKHKHSTFQPKFGTTQDYLKALECMHYDFWHYRYYIQSARASKQIRRYLKTIHNYKADIHIPGNIKSKLNTLKRKVQSMYMYDYTRDKLDKDLDKMVLVLTEAIRIENPDWEIPENYIRWPKESKL